MKAIPVGLLILVRIAFAFTIPVFACPYCHRHRTTFILWLAREIEEVYTGERRTGNCIPLTF